MPRGIVRPRSGAEPSRAEHLPRRLRNDGAIWRGARYENLHVLLHLITRRQVIEEKRTEAQLYGPLNVDGVTPVVCHV